MQFTTSDTIQLILVFVSMAGIVIAYFLFRNDLKRSMSSTMTEKMEDLKTMITIENRVGNLEKVTTENRAWHKDEFRIINQKLDATNNKLETLTKEFMSHIRDHKHD